MSDNDSGIYAELGNLPAGALVTEEGLAHLLGKGCQKSIKRAVDRGELPTPVKLLGKPTWTVGSIIAHIEERLECEVRKLPRLRA